MDLKARVRNFKFNVRKIFKFMALIFDYGDYEITRGVRK